jgi:hypothetical protein
MALFTVPPPPTQAPCSATKEPLLAASSSSLTACSPEALYKRAVMVNSSGVISRSAR